MLLRAGDAADLPDSPAMTPWRNSVSVLRGGLVGDGGQALVAGQVGGVDQGAQGSRRDLAGPDRVRVGLGGVLKITQQMDIMPISA